MRKTIGTNPLDAVVPDLSARSVTTKATKGASSGATSGATNGNGSIDGDGQRETALATPARPTSPPRPSKERLTIHVSVPLIDRAKNAVYWTPGLTLADLGERALEALVSELEKQNGKPFEARPHELKGGRPMK
jgi:hypothetical protein